MRVLFLCHGHPSLQAGGTELASLALFRALRAQPGIDGLFVGGASALHRPSSPGTPFQSAGAAADELLMRTEGFDRFHLSQTDLHGIAPELEGLLRSLQPDIVHLHHVLLIGVEALHLIRRTLPRARIVLTLHDFYAICPRDGLMRTTDGRLCHQAAVDACRRCFPDRSSTELRMRELHVRNLYRLVDRFVSPSRFLRERHLAWGLDPARVEVLRNGMPATACVPHRRLPQPEAPRDRFAFFGHINEAKGSCVALAASRLLSAGGVPHALALHGGADFQTEAFLDRFRAALVAAPAARHTGAYAPADLATRMAEADWVVMPSVWWENAPLVIQEAFQHRRPVITCSVGGMAEAVRDGGDGLLVHPDDPASLADAMRRAAGEPGLWDRLVGGIQPPHLVSAAASEHLELYRRLLTGRDAAPDAAAVVARPKRTRSQASPRPAKRSAAAPGRGVGCAGSPA